MDPYTTHIVLLNRLGEMLGEFKDHAVWILIATVLVFVSFPLGEMVRRILASLLPLFGWESLCRSWGLTRVIQKVRPDWAAVYATAQAGGLFTVLSLIMKALDVTGIQAIAWIGRGYFDLLPHAFQAGLIFLAAGAAATWIGKLLLLAAPSPWAGLAAGMARAAVWGLGLHAGLLALGFGAAIVLPLVLILMAGWTLAMVLEWRQGGGSGRFGREVIRVRAQEEQTQ